MADLAGALDAVLRARYGWTGVKTPVTQRRGLLARMNQMEKGYAKKGDRPGQAATRAAQAAGIAPRTWRDWRKGTHPPSARSVAKLEKAYKDRYTLPALRRSIGTKGVPKKVNVTSETKWNGYYNQTAKRLIRFGPGGVPATMQATIRAWAHDGPEAAALAFEYGLSAAHSVPNDADGMPGIRFEGNVHIEFP